MAYSDNYPAQRPVFSLDAANAGRLDPRMTFTRASTANVWDGSKHLSSDNLLLQSSSFDTTWTLTGIDGTPTGGQADPAGGTDGFTVVESSGGTYHRLHQTITPTGDLALTVYAKQNAGTRYLCLTLYSDSPSTQNFESAVFDLAGGAAATLSGSSSSFTSVTTSQTASGNGYYKCVLKATGTIKNANISLHNSSTTSGLSSNNGLPTYTGDGTSSIDIAFASLSTTGATDYNATTTQIHREYAPSLVSKSNNIGRFDHSTDGQSMGILIEGQSTNLIERSHEVDNSYWNNANGLNVTVDANVAISPTGDLTADMLRPTTDATAHYLQKTVMATVASTTYTMSAYVKSVGGLTFRMYFVQSASPYTTIASGVFTLSGDGSVASVAGSASIEKVNDDGWYRISVTGAALTTTSTLILQPHDSGGNLSFAGDGYSGILCTGLQFEANSFPSSLVSTSGASATRAAESLSMDLTQAGFNGGPVSIVGEFAPTDASVTGSKRVLSLSDGSDTENVRVHLASSRMYSVVRSGSSNTAVGYNSNALNDGEAVKFGLAVDTDSLIASTSGFNSLGTTGAVLPSQATRLGISEGHSGGQTLNSHWKSVKVYSEPLSLTNLQALTS